MEDYREIENNFSSEEVRKKNPSKPKFQGIYICCRSSHPQSGRSETEMIFDKSQKPRPYSITNYKLSNYELVNA
jgi:hypothetical protein